mmetsp:Transcript_45027/g.51727  ORF Transcript_45027/g.51727 Transcript_45027/m.51727 type:complete len:236 (+) Transcript_45027:62-769(+)
MEETLEHNLILRVPDDLAEKLQKITNSAGGADSSESKEVGYRLEQYVGDPRRYRFILDREEYEAELIDLPTIIEAQKTVDNKNFFKAADICQMLYVHPKSCVVVSSQKSEEVTENEANKEKDLEDSERPSKLVIPPKIECDDTFKSFVKLKKKRKKTELRAAKSGLTPGTKFVQQKRYRVKPDEKPCDVHRVEMALKNILDSGTSQNFTEELIDVDSDDPDYTEYLNKKRQKKDS